ncbi:hypothetical protein [Shewanella colwelliana]|uniref:hypothetical protein n=1 Tax=Shewanella colwelliana TaxID=23 RepID=UPI0022AEAAA3|nr:hypothetical protein [Shewanella colwelliana]MCZ4337729.1 hypothetical protein [Shewanella colwelliana]
MFFVDESTSEGETVRAAHFKHFGARGDSDLQAELDLCPYYHGSSLNVLFSQFYKGEGEWHYRTKHWLKGILETDPFVKPGSVHVEKYVFGASDTQLSRRRRPDISFLDRDAQTWAIELTNNWMNPEVITARQAFFIDEGINLLWLFSPGAVTTDQTSSFRYVLFGMSEREEGGQFNAFVLTDANVSSSTDEGLLEISCVYPHFEFDAANGSIEYTLHMQQTAVASLRTASASHLPYLVDTMESRNHAENALRQHEQQRDYEIQKLDALGAGLCLSVSNFILESHTHSAEAAKLKEQIDAALYQYQALGVPADRPQVVALVHAGEALGQHQAQWYEKHSEYRHRRQMADQRRQMEQDTIRQQTFLQLRSLVNEMNRNIEKHTPTLSILSIPNFEKKLSSLFKELKSNEWFGLEEELQQCLTRYDDQYISEIKRELSPLTRPVEFSRKYLPIIDKAMKYRTDTHYYGFPNSIAEKAQSYAEEALNRFSSILYWQVLETLAVLDVDFPSEDDVRQLVAINRYYIEINLHRAAQFDFSWKLDQLDNYASSGW